MTLLLAQLALTIVTIAFSVWAYIGLRRSRRRAELAATASPTMR